MVACGAHIGFAPPLLHLRFHALPPSPLLSLVAHSKGRLPPLVRAAEEAQEWRHPRLVSTPAPILHPKDATAWWHPEPWKSGSDVCPTFCPAAPVRQSLPGSGCPSTDYRTRRRLHTKCKCPTASLAGKHPAASPFTPHGGLSGGTRSDLRSRPTCVPGQVSRPTHIL